MKSHERAPTSRTINASVGLLTMIWGSTYFVIRAGLADLSPFTAATCRFIVAGTLFALFGPRIARREGGVPPSWRASWSFGLANVALPYAIVYWSETVLPSGLVSVLWASFPMMMGVAGHLFVPGERLHGRQWAGLGLGFVGICILFATDLRSLGSDAVVAGLILLVSPAATAIGTIWVKAGSARTSSALLNRNGMLIASLTLGALAFAFEEPLESNWSARAVGSVLYLAILGTFVAFGTYYWALRHAPAYRLSMIAYLTPVLALVLGTLAGDEPFALTTVLGSLTIFAGVALVMNARPSAPVVTQARQ